MRPSYAHYRARPETFLITALYRTAEDLLKMLGSHEGVNARSRIPETGKAKADR